MAAFLLTFKRKDTRLLLIVKRRRGKARKATGRVSELA